MYGHMTAPNFFGLRDILNDLSRLSQISGGGKTIREDGDFFSIMMEALAMQHSYNKNTYEAETQNNTDNTQTSSMQIQKDESVNVDSEAVTSEKKQSPTRTMRQVITDVGQAEADLLNKINNSLNKEARLQYEEELRDKIIDALRNEGYTVNTTEELDKISINGKVYDVIRNHGVLGKMAKVQLNSGRNRNNTNSNNEDNKVKDAIFRAAEDAINLLVELRGTTDPAMQDHLASMIQQIVVDNLNADGYNASALVSPDTIMVNGVKYDFIRGLGTGSTTQFAALKIG
jgi:DNA-directed RNA polymerase specialized sigma54-like protein